MKKLKINKLIRCELRKTKYITTWNLAVSLVNYELHQNQHKFNSPAVLLYIKNEVFVFYRTQHLSEWNLFTSIPLRCTVLYFVFFMFSRINWFMQYSRLNLIILNTQTKRKSEITTLNMEINRLFRFILLLLFLHIVFNRIVAKG